MQAKITIELEVSGPEVLRDVIDVLEIQLPYMTDNVSVRSELDD